MNDLDKLYISKIGKIKTKRAWLMWARSIWMSGGWEGDMATIEDISTKIEGMPADIWDRVVRVLTLNEVNVEELKDKYTPKQIELFDRYYTYPEHSLSNMKEHYYD